MTSISSSTGTGTAISVAGLTDYLQAVVETDATLRQLWIVGEVSSAKSHAVGLFFTLKDLEGSETLNCVVWRSQLGRLTHRPAAGEQLIVLGTVKLYPQRSSYQLMVWQVLPGGSGLRSLRYQQLKQRLQAEGLFDPEYKQVLPSYPQVIAVVTSPQAAAWGDIQRTLKQHHPGVRVLLSPATVQGATAPATLVAAVERVVVDGRAEVVIMARGGGAPEDLECFNDERVVRAIAQCPVPVVTGIGHQQDESLADLVADVHCHTPTAAAIAAVPALEALWFEHHRRWRELHHRLELRVGQETDRLTLLRQRCQRLRLDRQLQQAIADLLQRRLRLRREIYLTLQRAQDHRDALAERLTALDPSAVLRRGYAVATDQSGQAVTNTAELALGQPLTLRLAQGTVEVEVTAIEPTDASQRPEIPCPDSVVDPHGTP